MSIHVALHHRTEYRYERPVALGPQVVRLRPAPHCRTPILSYSLRIAPEGHFLNWQQDPQGNYLARLVFPEKVEHFTIEVDLVAEMAVYNPFDFFLEDYAETMPFTYPEWMRQELTPFFKKIETGPRFAELVASCELKGQRTIDFLVELNRVLNERIRYVIRLEPGVYAPEETLTRGEGSCRDTSWLLVQVLRHLGYATRFVSGYLIQLKPDQKSLDGPSGAEADFTDLHAWAEVYLPGAGWIGLDPTSGLLAGEGHLPLACTPEPPSAAPLTGGVMEKVESEFSFAMTVQRVAESPRVTKPYTEEAWAAINALGEAIDGRMGKAGMHLTMGGEPTFVSIDDMEGAEWNTSAVGPRKRVLSERLLKRLWKRFGEGGFLHYGQGKWYPGEPLPRWAYACIWRKDGQPLWQRPELLADLEKDTGVGPAEAAAFARELSTLLGVGQDHLMPGYEDAWYYLWKERRLPTNVDPLQSRLADPQERARLAQIFEQGLDKVVGYALPLERAWQGEELCWTSGPWFLRPETLFLHPGDSPMGLRLPLESLPWVKASEYPFVNEPDPTLALPPLPDREALARQYAEAIGSAGPDSTLSALRRHFGAVYGEGSALPGHLRPRPRRLPAPDTAPSAGRSAPWIVRTALCIEPREGNLFVFMPPTTTTEDYVDLLTAVEHTAARLDQPVVIEGYLPPHDHRLQHLKITPDPGVIEVNIHPSADWKELVHKTEVLYEEARQTRLGTEKFMLDGRHTGTGGGNHIVIGGDRPSESPLLRRPDLLKSLLAYWQHHPALSYLFSGLFIGPTSQAPRVDEARHDNLRELELAFREIDRVGADAVRRPWIVDRVFRNLLTDLTGNTHRAEFCIDKLYSPDSATGRLGLLELRSFEMPPHERMSLTQHLLLRGLLARFWEQPYERAGRLVDWGTALHDRWMLPHFIEEDIGDIVDDLRRWGMPFEGSWFAPHLAFRFPRYGEADYRGIHLELRQALEPWHVLGEEPGGGGTVRYVDSSVERVQVKVNGLTDERHVLTCNGRPVPLHATGRNHEYVAGVRYRAWQPEACLHPTIPVDTPLVFDLVDTWSGRALGGCTYYVAHPGGRNYETFPINAYEAESRRLARFTRLGHTPGRLSAPPPAGMSKKFPYTLDLREPDA
jgi:uncharacterized protein (DUF2126 family)/transglutaminase-like putative cysteine protease